MGTKKTTLLHLLRIIAALLSAFLVLILFTTLLRDTHAQATISSPSISVSQISATLPISDAHTGQVVTKTLYFNNASPGQITVTWEITGSPPFTLVVGAAFGDGEHLLTGTLAPWTPSVSYGVEVSSDSYPGVTYLVTDSTGLTSTAVIHYLRDIIQPASLIWMPMDGSVYTYPFSIMGTAGDVGSGVEHVSVRILSGTLNWSGSAWVISETWLQASGTSNWSLSSGLPGWESNYTYTVHSQAGDYVENVESPGDSSTFLYDALSPWSTILVPQDGICYASLTVISGTAGDDGGSGLDHVQVRIMSDTLSWDGSAWVPWETWLQASGTHDWSLTTGLPGWESGYSYTVHSRASDVGGNVEQLGDSIAFCYDAESPWSMVHFPQDGGYYSNFSIISGTAGDTGGAGLSYVDVRILSGTLNWDGSAWVPLETWLRASGTTSWTLTSNLPGCQHGCSYSVRSRATDKAGNKEVPESGNAFTCDTMYPWTVIDVPEHGAYYSSLAVISGTAGDVGPAEVSYVDVRILSGTLNWDGSAWVPLETWLRTSGTTNWSLWSGLPDWASDYSYTVRSRATDGAGNEEVPGDGNTFSYDDSPPWSVINFPQDGAYYRTLSALRGFAGDGGGIGVDYVDVRILSGTLNWNGSTWTTDEAWLRASGTTNWTFLSTLPTWEHGHAYTVHSRATDELGNEELPGGGNTFTYDVRSPTISSPAISVLINPQAFHVEGLTLFYTNTRGSGTFAVVGSAVDNVSGLERATFSPVFGYTPVEDDTPSTFAGVYDLPNGAVGNGTITATVYDRAGNSALQNYFYEMDRLAPFSQVESPAYAADAPITVTWAATDTQSGVFSATLWYKTALTGTWSRYQSLEGSSGTFEFSPPEGPGVYSFTTTAVDEVGNEEPLPAQSDTHTVYDPNDPQSAVTWAPAHRTSGPITMTWEATSDSPLELSQVRLWYSSTNTTGWIGTSISAFPSSHEAGGVFTFTPTLGEGVYDFATVASTARRSEATPSGRGDATTIYRLHRVYMPLILRGWSPWYRYDVHEPNDSPSQAYGPLTSSHQLDSYIWNASDPDDYFYFQPSVATQVEITLTNIPAERDYDLYVYYYDGQAYQTVAYSIRGGEVDEYVTFPAVANETYYIRIFPYEGYSEDPYRLILNYEE